MARTEIFFKECYRKCKKNVKENEALIQVDFAENYTTVYQDEVQNKYYFKDQITLHNAVAYYRLNDKEVTECMSVVSDYMSHRTTAVHAFLKPMFKYLTDKNPKLEKVIMVSDGATAQYKNYKNIASLLKFKKMYNLDAEWHFSASCHGKGAVDGIGATIKKNARNASIRNRESIRNAAELHTWTERHMPNVKTFLVMSETVKRGEPDFESMIDGTRKIIGIRDYHSFIPTTNNEIECSPYSGGPKTNHLAFRLYRR